VTCPRYVADRITGLPSVTVHASTEIRELVGRESLEELVVADLRTGRRQRIAACALFVFIGAGPFIAWLGEQVAVDRYGFVLTGPDIADDAVTEPCRGAPRWPYLLETSRLGVFAAGDVRSTTATVFPSVSRVDKRFYEGQPVAGKSRMTLSAVRPR